MWEIRQLGGLYIDRGGFHIWPEGTNVSEASDQTEQAVLTAMRAEFGSGPPCALRALFLLASVVTLAIFAWWRWRS